MSEAKAPKKSDTSSQKSEPKKTESAEPAKSAESTPAEKKAGGADAAPKSASELSISHFSSVSTPAYRSGWDSIFGGKESGKKAKSTLSNGSNIPVQFVIPDDEIDEDLRNTLYKIFQRKARKQGISLAKIKKGSIIEYSIECNVINE